MWLYTSCSWRIDWTRMITTLPYTTQAPLGAGARSSSARSVILSSMFYPEINEIRRDGSYIYKFYDETQGTDIKMYTIGPDYRHAKVRKSPAIDGKVKRNADGKKVRFPVILTLREKEIARR